MAIVYEITDSKRGILFEEIEWIGALNPGIAELCGVEILDENHNGSDVYFIRRNSHSS